MSNNEASRSDKDEAGFHIIAGSGGCRAMLATIGMLLALFWFGIRKIKSAGGISGGAIPMVFLAAGFNVRQIVKLAVDLDFQGGSEGASPSAPRRSSEIESCSGD